VDGPRHEFLSGASLPEEDVRAGDLIDLVEDGPQRGAPSHDVLDVVVLADLGLKVAVLGLEARPEPLVLRERAAELGVGPVPLEITVYKVGDKYVGARSNEFGYANYEIVPAVAELNPLGPIGKSRLR
jgi:hypothetical protein